MENKKRWRHRATPEAIEAGDSATARCRMQEHIREIGKLAFAAQSMLVTELVAFVGSSERGVTP
jgi:DNA-binding FadR family transcriptional regulator